MDQSNAHPERSETPEPSGTSLGQDISRWIYVSTQKQKAPARQEDALRRQLPDPEGFAARHDYEQSQRARPRLEKTGGTSTSTQWEQLTAKINQYQKEFEAWQKTLHDLPSTRPAELQGEDGEIMRRIKTNSKRIGEINNNEWQEAERRFATLKQEVPALQASFDTAHEQIRTAEAYQKSLEEQKKISAADRPVQQSLEQQLRMVDNSIKYLEADIAAKERKKDLNIKKQAEMDEQKEVISERSVGYPKFRADMDSVEAERIKIQAEISTDRTLLDEVRKYQAELEREKPDNGEGDRLVPELKKQLDAVKKEQEQHQEELKRFVEPLEKMQQYKIVLVKQQQSDLKYERTSKRLEEQLTMADLHVMCVKNEKRVIERNIEKDMEYKSKEANILINDRYKMNEEIYARKLEELSGEADKLIET